MMDGRTSDADDRGCGHCTR